MPRKTYPPEYRQQIVDLARSGESAEKLSQRFEPSAKTIRDWVRAADRKGKPPQDKDAEIERLLRENAILREERELLKKAAAWFAIKNASSHKKRSGSLRRSRPNFESRRWRASWV